MHPPPPASDGGLQRYEVVSQTLENAPFRLAWVDAEGLIQACNPAFSQHCASSEKHLRGTMLRRWIPDLLASRWHKLWEALADGKVEHLRSRWLDTSEQTSPCELVVQRIRSSGVSLAAVYVRDLSDQTTCESIQALQHEVLEAIVFGRPLPVVMELLCRRVERLAPEVLCSVLQVREDATLWPLAAPSLPMHYSDALRGMQAGPCAGSCGTAAWRGEAVEVVDIEHDPLWADYRSLALPLGLRACWSTPITARDGRVVGTFALYYREARRASGYHRRMVQACVHLCALAIEHSETEARIHQLAFYDPLTGLPNRANLRERANLVLAQMGREARQVCVLFLDLDRFKHVNDSLGHAAGDALLLRVAQRLHELVRDSDTVSRLGGDEFVVLLPGCDAGYAAALAERLARDLGVRMEVGDVSLAPSCSIGIALFPDDATDFDTLLKHADLAMYQAKAAGRSTFRFFRSEMNRAARERLELETALREGIARGELALHYQPQINLADGSLHALEALVRWINPRLGMVPPERFIALAEDCGLILQVDAWVQDEACRQLASWRAAGLAVPAISVNLSPAHFRDGELALRIARLLTRHGLTPHCLTLEITEGLMMDRSPETVAALNDLAALGVRLSIDDFGTGYSNLGYLKHLPVSELKIDRSFVRDLEANDDDRALASAILRIGESLHHLVVAEGVETAGQSAFLRERGCAIGQGYYYCRPLPATQLEAYLRQLPR